MQIAVNTRFLIPKQLEGYGYFTREVFLTIAEMKPEHNFVFFFDRPFDSSIKFPGNVQPVIVNPAARHALSFKWWFDVKIARALKKYKADVFVSPDGFCSLTTTVPQVLVVHDLAFLHYPKLIAKHHLWFYKRYTPKFLKKAKVIATVSEFSKEDIVRNYKIDADKILNVSSASKEIFKPMDWMQKEIVKQEYADGCEYFVFVGGIHPRKNLMNLLKAFSIFKKWQKTNMKLLVVGRLAWQHDDTLEKLKTFKYRDDVKMLGYLPEDKLAHVIASAYALVFPSFFEGFGVPVLEAMQCCVPVITSNTSSMPEIGGEAALYANPASPEDIAAQMKIIFKDEQLRNKLIEAGRLQSQKFSWEKTADAMWQCIEKAVSE
jgi:glycosyltransferase involved in cell wall biosynthesis